jgi:hypothetical protein
MLTSSQKQQLSQVSRRVYCEYCEGQAELVSGEEIYPHRPDLKTKKFYRCVPCKAYVGCHPGTLTPLGRLANADLRKAKMQAHAAFDQFWKSGQMTRSKAYGWLASWLGIPKYKCHIGMFDVEMCHRVVRACVERRSTELSGS